ncbi:MAG: hypothetical protein LBI42_12835 [Chitinispirillales bacterium]|jgi:riboflavin kinase/FMN adenylyltransferase|nr:hypothetical protein [Chitinispirillales bacterium]
MKIITQRDTQPENLRTAVTVGNFDGVHSGHSFLIKKTVDIAHSEGIASVAVTFDPHTRNVLYPQLSSTLLTTFEEKAALIENLGVDYLLRIDFNEKFKRLGAEQFIEQILSKQLHASDWVMGEGHSVGRDRAKGKKNLHFEAAKYHISIFTAALETVDETVISSTQIRKLINEGRVSSAVAMLGHPYLIMVERSEGLKIGTRLGYPTLNFQKPRSQKVIPPSGVYAAEADLGGRKTKGALYFGDCPTYRGREIHFEFHALEFGDKEPVVGEAVNVWLHCFIRPDTAFMEESALVNQITEDINNIKKYFSQER